MAVRRTVASAVLAFAAFGTFWGVWGASVPRVQDQAGLTDGQLGFALVFVGAGALPAMLVAGRALDRWGRAVVALTIAALGVSGAVVALTAVGVSSLSVGLALVGASSGAADVAINAVAGRAEKLAGRPVITRAHGVFSAMVVVASLGCGLASSASLPLAVPFVAAAVLCLVAALAVGTIRPPGGGGTPDLAAKPPDSNRPDTDAPDTAVPDTHALNADAPDAGPPIDGRPRTVPLLLLGVLGALAFASENAHQSWSAVYVHAELGLGPGGAAVAPAVFAGTVALARFAAGGLGPAYARAVLVVGSSVAAAGATVMAVAPTFLVAALGLVLAAAGTAVLFPTLVGLVSRSVDERHRGRATSLVSTTSYLGFLLGPGYVGLWADAVGLRGAMLAVAALAAVLCLLTPALLRLGGHGRLPALP
ncbi:MFS transporter [Actinopolymorpha sp. B11F2]|uniref:MFS transporter n=1 Tax=Actinopolymorpha sp. B11F2 TaxID=3160862 RepID=UPI0032E3FCEC